MTPEQQKHAFQLMKRRSAITDPREWRHNRDSELEQAASDAAEAKRNYELARGRMQATEAFHRNLLQELSRVNEELAAL